MVLNVKQHTFMLAEQQLKIRNAYFDAQILSCARQRPNGAHTSIRVHTQRAHMFSLFVLSYGRAFRCLGGF